MERSFADGEGVVWLTESLLNLHERAGGAV
jgi:hypothetical protein